MTEETLCHAQVVCSDIREMRAIIDILNAEYLDITIEGNTNGIEREREFEGNSTIGEAFKTAMLEVATEKLNQYTAEFEAL